MIKATKKENEEVLIEIKHRYEDKVLFSYTCENNTIKLTLLKAIEMKADLSYADLRFANLRYANLNYAKGTFVFNYGVKLKVVKQ